MEGRSGHVVRLIHRGTNNRALLKGFTGPVLDIAFATSATSLLACVDQGGNVFVWDLSKTDSTLSDVNRYTSSSSPFIIYNVKVFLLTWCHITDQPCLR